MNCTEVRALLSAYHDGELTEERCADVVQHLDTCPTCAQELAQFAQLSSMARVLPHAIPPSHVWTGIERHLAASDDSESASVDSRRWRIRPRLAMAAASLLAFIGVGWLIAEMRNAEPNDKAFAVEFGEYLAEFRRSPADAQQTLVSRYDGQAVDRREFLSQVGYRPAISRGLPAGYTVHSTQVLDMPCCRCVQSLCKTSDGSMFAVFEHDDSEQHWYGDRPEVQAVCQGKQCRLVGLDDRLAASWEQGGRHITVIGIESLEEVNELVAWFEGPSA